MQQPAPGQQVVYVQSPQPAAVVVAAPPSQSGCCNHQVRNAKANIIVGAMFLVCFGVGVISNIVLISKCTGQYTMIGNGLYVALVGSLMLTAGLKNNACCDTAALVLNIIGAVGGGIGTIFYGLAYKLVKSRLDTFEIVRNSLVQTYGENCYRTTHDIFIVYLVFAVVTFILYMVGSILGCISCCRCCNAGGDGQGGAVLMQQAPVQPGVQYQQVNQ